MEDKKMKKAIEKVVPENIDIAEEMIRLATKSSSWIFISINLLVRLKNEYSHYPYARQDGYIFELSKEDGDKIFVDCEYGYGKWRRVHLHLKKDIIKDGDVEVIYFLS